MRIQSILNTVNHRPWPIPQQQWKFYQEWNRAIFLHWKVELSELKKFVPNDLEIDLFEGEAWVSLVAFTMEKIRPRNLPHFSPISNFDEINIRTYVKYKGKPGVFFLSIEGGKSISCKMAKSISQLPYRFSRMQRKPNQFFSKNSEFNDQFDLKFKVSQKLSHKPHIDLWLTESYALFQNAEQTINGFEIQHKEWPLDTLEIESITFQYKRFSSLIQGPPNRTAYSNGVKVLAWEKTAHPMYTKS